MRSYRFISLIVTLLLSLASLSAQTAFSLKGTVTDEEGMPLYECIVYISETKGTVTDSLGHYSLSIPNDKTVEIHYACLGYEDVILTFSPEGTFPLKADVVLKAVTLLDDVVIMDPAPLTPRRRVEPPTFVTTSDTDLIKATKPDYYDQVRSYLDGLAQGKSYGVRKNFPPEAIPALLSFADDMRMIKNPPTDPLSSYLPPSCSVGVFSLWLIECIRRTELKKVQGEDSTWGHLPLVPQLGSVLYGNIDYITFQNSAARSYRSWWNSGAFESIISVNPLDNTGLHWH